MNLYEIDPELLKKTVTHKKKDTDEKPKRKRAPKKSVNAEIIAATEEVLEEEKENVVTEEIKDEKPKTEKPKTEKQLAAIEKRKETLRLKKEAEELKKASEELKNKEKLEKKAAANERRRLARLAKKQEKTPTESENDEPKPKRVKKEVNPDEPPTWFKAYLKQAKKIEPSKEEAVAAAEETWKDTIARDKLNNEVKNHNHRMYSMIFHGRNR